MKQALAALVLLLLASPTLAQNIAVCGASTGQSYYLEHGLVSQADSGLRPDGIAEGSMTLSAVSDTEVDILYRDATGGVHSSRGDGGQVLILAFTELLIHVLVVYPAGSVEAYLFDVDGGEVVYTISRSANISKASIFRASCVFAATE